MILQWICVCLLFSFVLIKPSFCIHDDPQYTACAPKSCGGAGINVSYPFRITDQQDSACGFPGFDVTCNIKNETIIDLFGSNYTIKNIYHNNQTIRVVDSKFAGFSSNDACSVPFQNLTLRGDRFNFSLNYMKLLILSSCNSSTWELLDDYKINGCLGRNESDPVFAILEKEYLNVSGNIAGMCRKVVEVPVENGKYGGEKWWRYYEEVFERGFMLQWMATDCGVCADSGGRCGFDAKQYQSMCYCTDRPHFDSCPGSSPSLLIIGRNLAVIVAVCGFAVMIAGSTMFCCFTRENIGRVFKRKSGGDHDLDEFMRNYGSLAPKRYNYADVKRITKSFANKLGQGGYGSVYKGKLSDGRLVAVKMLNNSNGNGRDFLNEVSSISRTSHVNVVSLLGFCYRGTKRALIYEYMPNLSLDKFIRHKETYPKTNSELDCTALSKIAVGVARGLEYLHMGCNTRILHLDIKPHNILLDEDWCPKISDFGLAKLCQRKDSMISTMGARGTIGYIAPEVFNRAFGRVSYKSDVYSYGMMILEMAGVGKQAEGLKEASEMYFPDWIYKMLEAGPEGVAVRADGIITEDKDKETERKMIMVGLWCIQTKPADRPTMAKVIEMLEGSIDLLQTPPKPFLFAPSSTSPPKAYSSSSLSSSMSQIIDIQS